MWRLVSGRDSCIRIAGLVPGPTYIWGKPLTFLRLSFLIHKTGQWLESWYVLSSKYLVNVPFLPVSCWVN